MAERISAIIPAHNEADVIRDTIGAALGIPGVTQLIVVDDGSSDDTAEVARLAGPHDLLVLKRNLGKGGALNRAWPLAVGEVLLLLDADLGKSASEGCKLLQPVLDGSADMTIALFGGGPPAADGKLAARSRGFGLVRKTSQLGIRLLTGKRIQSPLAGPRAVRREVIEKIGGFASRFGVETGLTVDALKMGFRIVEVPVNMVHRPSGRDLKGFMHRGRQMRDVLLTLARKTFR